jgi:hypothetical protein
MPDSSVRWHSFCALLMVKSPKATHRSASTIEIEAAAMTQAIAQMESLHGSPCRGRA